MEFALIIISIVTLFALLFTLVEFIFGFKQIKNLSDQVVLQQEALPAVSIILSALNEEAEIETALTSMLKLNYPRLEIIAINDRSTDKTPSILAALQKRYPALQVHHIQQLPSGWLGKNHALYFAAKKASGAWLLFTDADVVMKTETLMKAMSYVLTQQLDHLTIHEHHLRHHFGLKILLLGHYATYSMVMKPWRIRHAHSKKSLGHGAFNLVKRSAYEACHGHRAIAMECLDDLKLGALLKSHGFKQDTVDGRDFIERNWYHSLSDMITGFKKNSFAFYDYQLLPLLRDSVFAFLFYFWPLISLFFFSGAIRWLNLINVFLTLFLFAYVAKQFRLQQRYAVFYPLSISFLLYALFNSAIAIYRQKGVVWRGTHYSLQQLKSKKIP